MPSSGEQGGIIGRATAPTSPEIRAGFHACEVASDRWSLSAVACTWAAYCRFQRTSSIEGRRDDSEDKHLSVMEMTSDRGSSAAVPSTAGSIICFRPSCLLNDVLYKRRE